MNYPHNCGHPPETWTEWTCNNCGLRGCRSCFAFKNPTVDFCVNCVGDWVKRKDIKSMKEADKILERQFCVVGSIVYKKLQSCIETRQR